MATIRWYLTSRPKEANCEHDLMSSSRAKLTDDGEHSKSKEFIESDSE
jgi:hypothetical protein